MRRLVATVVLVLLLPTAGRGQTEAVPEYDVKAAFLFNFTRFVTWPAQSATSTPFTVCVVGEDPFGPSLERAFENRIVQGGPVAIRRQQSDVSVRGCHMVFVTDTDLASLREFFDELDGQSVLTVGEGEAFARRGGIIALTLAENKVRFSINEQQARRAGLTLNAQFLSLATIVESDQ